MQAASKVCTLSPEEGPQPSNARLVQLRAMDEENLCGIVKIPAGVAREQRSDQFCRALLN